MKGYNVKQLPTNTLDVLNKMAANITMLRAYDVFTKAVQAMCDKNGYEYPLFSFSRKPSHRGLDAVDSGAISNVQVHALPEDAPLRKIVR